MIKDGKLTLTASKLFCRSQKEFLSQMTKEDRLKLANTPPGWMYEFDLGDGILTPLLTEELRQIHQTRERMIFPVLEEFFQEGFVEKSCLDVACNEGYFSFLLYKKGAKVKGIDVRPLNIERAKSIREVYGYDSSRLMFDEENFLSNQDPPNHYDLTLFFGLLYHIENPIGAIRILHRITRRLCVVETQLTRQESPVFSGWGETGKLLELPASMGLYQETDMTDNNLAAYQSLSLIPNAAAVRQLLFSAGFSNVFQVIPPPGLNQQYIQYDRGIFLAFK